MKKILCLLLSLAFLLPLAACSSERFISLGEKEGAFQSGDNAIGYACPHFTKYDRAGYYDGTKTYPNTLYHAKVCIMAGKGYSCPEPVVFEKHDCYFYKYTEVRLRYNGRYYHTALLYCLSCLQDFKLDAGTPGGHEYVYCSAQSENCDGTCQSALDYAAAHTLENDPTRKESL